MANTDIKTIKANGIEFAYLEQGEGPLVLCLHGFPDTAYSFESLIKCLGEAGYRAVAPFMRGYHPTSLAKDGDYSVLQLANDVLALIDAFGENDACVIGHDWGGFATYTAANMAPEKLKKIVLMCVPHMHCPAMTLRQLCRSWYVFFFQLPWLPEKRVPRNNFQFIDRLYRAWSPNWNPAEFNLEPLKKSLAAPGGLHAAISYYRSMISGASKEQKEIISRKTDVPSLCFAGEADGSIDIAQFKNIDQAYTSYFEFISYKNVGHFPHRENPDECTEKVIAFLKKETPPILADPTLNA